MATGPALTHNVIDKIYKQEGWRYIGISDCYRICPFLDFHYACDNRWWGLHYDKVMEWGGSRNGYWCTEKETKSRYPDLHWILGKGGEGWSTKQDLIHYGSNSGFQITNIAALLGIEYMVLVGFNMMVTKKEDGSPASHFFGDHPSGLSRNTSYHSFAAQFNTIKPGNIRVVNASHPTKLTAFPKMSLQKAIDGA
jgi:hypothetical protein